MTCREATYEPRISDPVRLEAEPAEESLDLRTYLNFLWRHWMFIGAVRSRTNRGVHLACSRDADLYGDRADSAGSTTRKAAARIPGCSTSSTIILPGKPANDHQIGRLLQRVVGKDGSHRRRQRQQIHRRSVAKSSLTKRQQGGAQRIQNAVNRLRGAHRRRARSGTTQALIFRLPGAMPSEPRNSPMPSPTHYILDQLDARFEAAKRTSGWLSDRLVELRQAARNSEEAVATFRKENGLVRTSRNRHI